MILINILSYHGKAILLPGNEDILWQVILLSTLEIIVSILNYRIISKKKMCGHIQLILKLSYYLVVYMAILKCSSY